MNSYMYNKNKDKNIESIISDFTQKYFWDKLNATRVTEKSLQIKGIDFQINRNNKTINFDEKAKLYGCLNQILKYPSFEITIKNRFGYIQDGWFLNPDSKTDFYAFLAVFTSASIVEDITVDNIEKINMLWVKKSDVEEYIKNNIRHDAKVIRDYIDLKEEAGEVDIDNRKKYSHGLYWLTYSYKLNERPVNLVIPRTSLMKFLNTKEFEITKDEIKKVA